eukprot:CAMPEP_0197021482 /NCGR_PEP_ID=MMETSP1384-20130603/2372_1 /TAXON_ID=29189 /ORGANISM="Ammonia sp." /LENGTH=37 /DNA_ID= /DNA_START= /DNA_END= /DNA_ORIENTATION=
MSDPTPAGPTETKPSTEIKAKKADKKKELKKKKQNIT